jgi:N utilization substance protein B
MSQPAAPAAHAKPHGKSRGSRPVSRELCLRALYQRQLTGADLARLLAMGEEDEIFPRANGPFFATLLAGVLEQSDTLELALAPFLDRPVDQLSPIERGCLLIGAYELTHSLDVPYRVVINEAVELAKRYGGTEGHKYVNGVLDQLAKQVRRPETEAGKR